MRSSSVRTFVSTTEPLFIETGAMHNHLADYWESQLETHLFGKYQAVEPMINKLGPTIYGYSSNERDDYLREKIKAEEILNSLFGRQDHPIDYLKGFLQDNGIRVARDTHGEELYLGIFRKIERGTPYHIDFAPHESPGWGEPSQVIKQYAVNYYLTDFNDGMTTVSDRHWTLEDDSFRFSDGRFGYQNENIEKLSQRFHHYLPSKGDMMIINSRNFHKVEPAEGTRLTLSFNFGELASGEYIAWS